MIKKIFLLIMLLFSAQYFLFAAEPLQNKTKDSAPNFTLLDLNNREVSLSSFKGKPVILFFWTTWCPHCRGELKQLNTMHADLLRNGVELVAINVEESADKIQRFIRSYPFSYRVLLDTDAEVAGAFGILGVPTYILINKEGHVVFNNHYFPQKEYKDLILK